MRGVRPFNEAWTEEPLSLQEILESPGVIVCSDCRRRGCVRVRGPEDYGCSFESEACETCHGWGAVVPKTADKGETMSEQEKTAVVEFTEWEIKSLLGYGGRDWAEQNAAALQKIRAECHKQWPIGDS